MANDVKRMRYFNGLFLKEEEFNLEQDYHIRMRRLHNRHLHKWGIAWGLDVEAGPGNEEVTIKEGMALNKVLENGEEVSQEIVVTSNAVVDLSSYNANDGVYLYVSYSKEEADVVQEKGGDKKIHWWEKAVIGHSKTKPTNENENIVLCKVVIKADGTIDTNSIKYDEGGKSLRTYAGFSGKELEIQKLTLSIEGITANLASIKGKVIDSQNGIEVNSPKTKFTGNLEITGDLNVKGTVNKTDQLEIKDNIIRVNKYAPQATPLNVNGGLEIYRGGTAPNAQLIWDEAVDKWKMGLEGSLTDIAYGPNADRLLNNSVAEGLHKHSSLSTSTGTTALSVDAAGNVGIGTSAPQSKLHIQGDLKINGFTKALGLSVNDATNSGIGRGLWLWSPTDSNHVIYSANPNGKSPADRPAARGYFNTNHRLRLRTAIGQGFLFENSNDISLVDIDSDSGKLWTKGGIYAGNSDIYFTETEHIHSMIGNTAGFAAIENSKNYNTLMILGRTVSTSPLTRSVSVWDELNVNGPLIVKRTHTIKIGVPSPATPSRYGNDGIRGEPNLWLDAANTVYIKPGFQTPTGFDIAERFKTNDRLEPGCVVVYDEKKEDVKLCKSENDKRVVGIVSTEPAFILGGNKEEIPIALCGRVLCKVDADIAPIVAGDLLTTSPTKGYAQKVLDPVKSAGAIIGKALGSLIRGKGEIMVLVTLQ